MWELPKDMDQRMSAIIDVVLCKHVSFEQYPKALRKHLNTLILLETKTAICGIERYPTKAKGS